MNAGSGPLADVTVLDLTRALAGPFATMLLADLGADVIKVEAPAGDLIRRVGPYADDDTLHAFGGYFQSVNRNKRSVVIDLTTEPGQAALLRLVQGVDILVENYRPGVMERLGLPYERLLEVNPRLVYGAIRGFGDPRTGKSPYEDRPAFDVVAQAMGGLMAITGHPDGPPTKVGPGIGDIFPACLAAVGVLAGLREVARTGAGTFVDVAMYDAILSLCERTIYQYSYSAEVAGREGNDHTILCPFGIFECQDGWVAIAAPVDGHWRTLCTILGLPELGRDPRYKRNYDRAQRRVEVRALVEAWTKDRTVREIEIALSGRVPFGPVNTSAMIYEDPHAHARGMLVELEQPGSSTPVTVAGTPIKFLGQSDAKHRRAPLLGEHTLEVLAAAGFSEQEQAQIAAQAR